MDKAPSSSITKYITTYNLRNVINNLKKEGSHLQKDITYLQTKNRELETKISLLTQAETTNGDETESSDHTLNLKDVVISQYSRYNKPSLTLSILI